MIWRRQGRECTEQRQLSWVGRETGALTPGAAAARGGCIGHMHFEGRLHLDFASVGPRRRLFQEVQDCLFVQASPFLAHDPEIVSTFWGGLHETMVSTTQP